MMDRQKTALKEILTIEDDVQLRNLDSRGGVGMDKTPFSSFLKYLYKSFVNKDKYL